MPAIRTRMLGLLSEVDANLAEKVASGLGVPVPRSPEKPMNHGVGADTDPKNTNQKRDFKHSGFRCIEHDFKQNQFTNNRI